MKRIGKKRFNGISQKLFVLILITIILITACFFGVTTYQNKTLRELMSEVSRKQQDAIQDITGSVMEGVARETLQRTTELEAVATNEIFADAKARVQLLCEYASDMFANGGSYSPKPCYGPDTAKDGKLVAQVIYADGTDPEDPKVQSAVGLAANMTDLMISVCDTFQTDNVYMALPVGAFISVSRNSASWFKEDGTPLSYDARTRFWYKQAMYEGKLIFTDVETDANTGRLSLVCAVPVYDPGGALRAVIGTDLFLDTMQKSLEESEKDGGSHLVVNNSGHVIANSFEEGGFRAQTSEEAEDLRNSENKELAAFITEALAGQTGVKLIQVGSEFYYMTGVPVETVGWAMISIYSQELMNRPAAWLEKSHLEIQAEAGASYRARLYRIQLLIFAILAVLLVVLSAAALLQGRRIVLPLNKMTKRISEMKEDNLEFNMEDTFRTGDEIEVLAESFDRMSHKTIEYVQEVRTVTAEKERMRSELHMAATIQSSMLPHIFPPFPDRKEFDLYADMDPAKEVGGDFYDFFLIDDDHLYMAIADVSGKGIPAALFMMTSKTILQNCAMMGHSAAEILTRTNDAICSNNQAGMFVTVWIGILEISTGKLTAANAGHEYPVLKRTDGNYELYRDKHGFVIGGMAGMKFKQYELQLNPGDRLFLYTDGVPEATDANNELFGNDRMVDALNTVKNEAPKEVIAGVRRAVDAFVKEAEQFDDMTMLCLEYRGIS